jgi:hypothetical protein
LLLDAIPEIDADYRADIKLIGPPDKLDAGRSVINVGKDGRMIAARRYFFQKLFDRKDAVTETVICVAI